MEADLKAEREEYESTVKVTMEASMADLDSKVEKQSVEYAAMVQEHGASSQTLNLKP